MQPLFTSTTEQASQLLGFIYEIFETANDDELIDGNPYPLKSSFTIPKKNVRHAASLVMQILINASKISLHYGTGDRVEEWAETDKKDKARAEQYRTDLVRIPEGRHL